MNFQLILPPNKLLDPAAAKKADGESFVELSWKISELIRDAYSLENPRQQVCYNRSQPFRARTFVRKRKAWEHHLSMAFSSESRHPENPENPEKKHAVART